MAPYPFPAPSAILLDIRFHPLTIDLAICLGLILVLLGASAFTSGAEVAYFSVSPADRIRIKSKATKKNKYLIRNLEAPEQLLATVLVVNNFVNVGIVILSFFSLNQFISVSPGNPAGLFVFEIVAISLAILVFGELVPKQFAARHALKVASLTAFPLYCLIRLFRPLNSILIYSSLFASRSIRAHNQQISVDELSQALELTSSSELTDDKEILKGIVKFGNKSVGEIMRSRVDVVSAEITDSYSKIMDMITETGFSRIPVYAESFDNIKGILYIKDLLPHVNKSASFRWQSIIRSPFFVPETKKIDDLLEEFQKNKVHMAIVVDEYGGTSGIVTLEDVLEEIVGEITDEFDEVENFYTRIGENKFLFDGKTLLSDFYKIIGTDEAVFEEVKGEADTLAGLILELKGEIPQKNDTINCKNCVFTIEAVDHRRILKVKTEVKPGADV